MRYILFLFVFLPVVLFGQSYTEEEEKFAVVYLNLTDQEPSADQLTETTFRNQKDRLKANYKKGGFTKQEARKFDQVKVQFQNEREQLLERLCREHQLPVEAYRRIYDLMTKDLAYQNRIGSLLQATAHQIRPK